MLNQSDNSSSQRKGMRCDLWTSQWDTSGEQDQPTIHGKILPKWKQKATQGNSEPLSS